MINIYSGLGGIIPRVNVPRLIIICHSSTDEKYLLYNFKNETPNFCPRQMGAAPDVGSVLSVNCAATGQYIFVILVSGKIKRELHGCDSGVTVHFRCCQQLILRKQMSSTVL